LPGRQRTLRPHHGRATQSPSEIRTSSKTHPRAHRPRPRPEGADPSSDGLLLPAFARQGARPTARGKKRGARNEDPLDLMTRKLDRWVEKNPNLSVFVAFCITGTFLFVFWSLFGETITWAYDKHLAEHVNPHVLPVLTWARPHVAALRSLLAERLGFLQTVGKMFEAQPAKPQRLIEL